MPYIYSSARKALDCGERGPQTSGELNYAFTVLCIDYLRKYPNYQGRNDIIGALECCKLEFVRRQVNPYEAAKCQENGDVY